MKYAHVTVYPKRIEWRCREHALVPDEGDTITGTETIVELLDCSYPKALSVYWSHHRDAWGRVMEVLTAHEED